MSLVGLIFAKVNEKGLTYEELRFRLMRDLADLKLDEITLINVDDLLYIKCQFKKGLEVKEQISNLTFDDKLNTRRGEIFYLGKNDEFYKRLIDQLMFRYKVIDKVVTEFRSLKIYDDVFKGVCVTCNFKALSQICFVTYEIDSLLFMMVCYIKIDENNCIHLTPFSLKKYVKLLDHSEIEVETSVKFTKQSDNLSFEEAFMLLYDQI